MIILRKKRLNKIAKHLAVIHILGKTQNNLAAFTKQIENVSEIACDLHIASEVLEIINDYTDRAKGEKA